MAFHLALCMAPHRVKVTGCASSSRRRNTAEFNKLEIIFSANGQFRMWDLQNILSEVTNMTTCYLVELALVEFLFVIVERLH